MSNSYTFEFRTFNGIVDTITVGGEDVEKARALARGYIKRRYGADSIITLVEDKKEEKENV